MNMQQIEIMKNADVRTVDKAALVDISAVTINPKDSPEKKVRDYIEQVKNPYCFLCNGYVVKLEFAETEKTIEDCFAEYLDTLL